jgi:hypothetical protein
MNHRNKPERRTFLQDRFDILIKRQQTGRATFGELTELDDIVNRDPELREKVIRENMFTEGSDDFGEPKNIPESDRSLPVKMLRRRNFLNKIKSFFRGIFTSKISIIKTRLFVSHSNQTILI